MVSAATHVLLDLDGTLSDSEPGIRSTLQWACRREGLPVPTDADVRSVIGPPFEVGLPRIGIPHEAVTRVVATYRGRYATVGAFENTLYPGVIDMLDGLADLGVTLSVATAKPEDVARRILDHFGISDRFAVRVGATHTPERRSKGQVIAVVLRELGLADDPSLTQRVVMVGDRDHDVDGARENGLDCIGVTWGYGTERELHGAGAVALARVPAEVVGLVRRAG